MNSTEENIALQAVEFWSTVCEEEIELAIETNEVCDSKSLMVAQQPDPFLRHWNMVKYPRPNLSSLQKLHFPRLSRFC